MAGPAGSSSSSAGSSSAGLGAEAYTKGSDVAFGAGKFDPGSSSGKELLGHELTHVVQQGQTNGFSKQGAQELMNGNVPSNPADRQRLRSSVPHPGAAGAPMSAGVGSLPSAKAGQ